MYNKLLLKKMLFFYLVFFLKSNCQELATYLSTDVKRDVLIQRIKEVKALIKDSSEKKTQKYFKENGITTNPKNITPDYNKAIEQIQEKSKKEITKTGFQAVRKRLSSRKDIRYSEEWLQKAVVEIEQIKTVAKEENAVKKAITNLSKKLTQFIASFSNGLLELKKQNETAFDQNVDQEFADTFMKNTGKIKAFNDQPEADNEFNFLETLKTGSESELQELKNSIKRSVTLAKYLFENSDENGKLVIKKNPNNPNNPNDEITIDLLEFAENNEFKDAFKKVKKGFTEKLELQTSLNESINLRNKADKASLKVKLKEAENKQQTDETGPDSVSEAESKLKAKTKSLRDEDQETIRNRNAALEKEKKSRKGAFSKDVVDETGEWKTDPKTRKPVAGSKTIADRSVELGLTFGPTDAKKKQLAVNKQDFKDFLVADFKADLSAKIKTIAEAENIESSAEFDNFLESTKKAILKKYEETATIGFKKGQTQQALEAEIEKEIAGYKEKYKGLKETKKAFTTKKANQEIAKQGIAQIRNELDTLKAKKAQDLQNQADAKEKISKSKQSLDSEISAEFDRKNLKAMKAAALSIPAKTPAKLSPAKLSPAKPSPAPAKPVKAPNFFLKPKPPKVT